MSLPSECPFEALLQEGKELSAWEKDTVHNWKQKPGRKSLGRTAEDIANRPLCSCGFNQVAISRQRVKGEEKVYVRKACHTCLDRNYKRASRNFSIPKDKCAMCGFKPQLDCQMDYDHIDGNHDNDSLSNIQVLCANCHRLKSYLNRDNTNLKFRKEGMETMISAGNS